MDEYVRLHRRLEELKNRFGKDAEKDRKEKNDAPQDEQRNP